ncbi:hypothetical protein, partial [Acinetobacter seifertii]|uniref:hypothetical protein n=1 Tax=Acinetobacter seifertii TaxID=1530123 RepID=UPI0020C698A9
IKNFVGELEFNNVQIEVKENLSIETMNFKNTKKISTFCLVAGVLCLFIPAFRIGAAILLVIGLATLKLKTEAKKEINIFNEILFF